MVQGLTPRPTAPNVRGCFWGIEARSRDCAPADSVVEAASTRSGPHPSAARRLGKVGQRNSESKSTGRSPRRVVARRVEIQVPIAAASPAAGAARRTSSGYRARPPERRRIAPCERERRKPVCVSRRQRRGLWMVGRWQSIILDTRGHARADSRP